MTLNAMYSQKNNFEKNSDLLFNQIRTFNLIDVDTLLLMDETPRDAFLTYSYYQLVKGVSHEIDLTKFIDVKLDYSQYIYYELLLGDKIINAHKTKKSDSIAYSHYLKAYDTAFEHDDVVLKCEVLKKVLKYLFKSHEDVLSFHEFAKLYRNLAYDLHEQLYAEYYYLGSVIGVSYDFRRKDLNPIPEGMNALNRAEKTKKFYLAGRLSQLIGVYHDIIRNELDSAGVFYNKSLEHYKKIPEYYAQKNRHDLSFNLGEIERERQNYSDALKYYNKIDLKTIPLRDSQDLVIIYEGMYESFSALKQIDSSLFYLEKKSSLQDSLQLIQRAKDVKEIQTRYDTEKKEIENQQLKERNKIILVSSVFVLFFGGFATFLFNKNTTKKRKLAEQQQLIEQQKVATLLKEQELTSIDAMIAGQEKERTKVANELHDDLGSLMATVKLHFDNVKVDQKDPALMNAQKLLDEAYQKIRGMAHAKNSGVMANQGLLPAVKKMAKTINETNALEVTVEDFGLGERMENSLELTIFRILQELVANIIKHAEATTASIQFTQHEERLNIIVEDNGKGFDMSEVQRASSGMGLGTIEKRIEHLEGTFTVDSVLGKGTSILIDIPV